jgi:lipopolysaccharide transport system ATP-binding protein
VASLLEVGTGFHPELTGRENIFLNGAILGMSKEEIRRKFDEIVAFAEVENFLDTPVKRYSSGMRVRLAFAVAAHLEPEILIVDEVLAVGDIQFQRKCLGKMQDISSSEGKTVLFVSHNLQAIEALCNKGFFIEHGNLINHGTIQEVAKQYTDRVKITLNNHLQHSVPLCMDYVLDRLSIVPGEAYIGQSVNFSLSLTRLEGIIKIDELALLIYSMSGVRLAVIDLRSEARKDKANTSQLLISGSIDRIPFVEGEYSIGVYIKTSGCSKDFLDLIKLTVKHDRSATVINGVVTLPYSTKNLGLVELNYSIKSPAISQSHRENGSKSKLR